MISEEAKSRILLYRAIVKLCATDNVIGLIKRKSMPAVSILLKISTYDFLEIYSLNQSTR